MEHIAQRESLLQEMLENTELQSEAMKKDNLEELDRLIAQREILIKKIDELPMGQSRKIKRLLTEIMRIDGENQLFMNKEFAVVKKELRKIRTGKKQEQRYGNEYGAYKEEGVFFDTKEYGE